MQKQVLAQSPPLSLLTEPSATTVKPLLDENDGQASGLTEGFFTRFNAELKQMLATSSPSVQPTLQTTTSATASVETISDLTLGFYAATQNKTAHPKQSNLTPTVKPMDAKYTAVIEAAIRNSGSPAEAAAFAVGYFAQQATTDTTAKPMDDQYDALAPSGLTEGFFNRFNAEMLPMATPEVR
jgi:hypothetical protein